MDRLLSFMIVTELQGILQYLDRNFTKDKAWQDILYAINENIESIDGKISGNSLCWPQTSSISVDKIIFVSLKAMHFSRIYGTVLTKASKSLSVIFDSISRIGQMQIIRSNIAHELNTSSKFQSRHLASALQAFNE